MELHSFDSSEMHRPIKLSGFSRVKFLTLHARGTRVIPAVPRMARSRFRGIMAIAILLLIVACATHPVAQPDPLAEFREASLRSAESRTGLMVVAASNLALRHRMHERVYGPVHQTRFITEDGEEFQALDRIQVTGSRVTASDLITNVQTAGIDEGGIVKRAGDVLVVLSGSVLHTVLLHENGDDSLRLVQSLELMDAKDGSGTWFDEVIAFHGVVLLLSYNFDDDLTEIRIFAMTPNGELSETGRVQIMADDYFSNSNYGLRLVGDEILFPVSVGLGGPRGTIWPMWRPVRPGQESDWQPLLEPDDILLPLVPVQNPTIYSVLQCGLDALLAQQMECRATGVVADSWSELYVGPNAAYVALDAWHDEAYLLEDFSPWHWHPLNAERKHLQRTLIYRIPLDSDETPGVVSVNGTMGDQFSFVETDGHLIAVTETTGRKGQRILEAHRVAESDFSDRLPGLAHSFARILVSNSHRTVRVTERYILIGEHGAVLHDDEAFGRDTVFIIQPTRRTRPVRLTLPQTVDRLELIGSRIFLSGQDADSQWSFRLIDPDRPRRQGLATLTPDYISSEERSHAFNWRQLSDDQVILGLPGKALDDSEPKPRFWWTRDQASDLLFFTSQGLDISEAGILDMQADNAPGDYCDKDYGCADWYGNARAIFINNRILALSGNRLDEGQLIAGRVEPIRSILLIHR